jgi:hypothetical protein
MHYRVCRIQLVKSSLKQFNPLQIDIPYFCYINFNVIPLRLGYLFHVSRATNFACISHVPYAYCMASYK